MKDTVTKKILMEKGSKLATEVNNYLIDKIYNDVTINNQIGMILTTVLIFAAATIKSTHQTIQDKISLDDYRDSCLKQINNFINIGSEEVK